MENNLESSLDQENTNKDSVLPVSKGATIKYTRKKLMILSIALIILFGLLSVTYHLGLLKIFLPEDTFSQALLQIQQITTYQQNLEMATSDQRLSMTGTAEIDTISGKSRSRHTTVTQGLEFDTDTIVIGDKIFTRINFKDSPMASMLAFPDSWIRFEASNLPEEYERFLASKDYQDILSLLKADSKYFTKISEDEQISGAHTVIHYKLALSPDLKNAVSGESMRNLIELLIKDGTIEFWVNKDTAFIEKLIVKSPSFKITIELSKINEPSSIDPPESFATEDEWKKERFLLALPKNKITEVFIGGYGGVPDKTMKLIEQSIESTFGVKTTILGNYQEAFPVHDGVYSKTRKQYDGDIIWEYFSNIFQKNGDTVRYIVVLNEDLYTKIQNERPYILSRSLPGLNTAIISIKRLANESDVSLQNIKEEIYNERIQKISLRTLGVTAGLTSSPDAENINCVMYQALTINELDKVGLRLCEATQDALSKVFFVPNIE